MPIHMITIRGRYLCNQAFISNVNKETLNRRKVTCENCKRIMKRNPGEY